MSLTLREVLAHPSLAAAEPVVVAGAESLDRSVRWVHTSEVLEIGMLLRGGELLLTGGVVLAAADPASQRRYLRELVASGVAGLAVEAGPGLLLPTLPAELVAEAAAMRFPLVELHRVAPFVEVSEAVNGIIVNESVRRLRSADALSHLLSSRLAEGGGPQDLLEVLADAVTCDALLLDGAGRVLFSTCADGEGSAALLASPTVRSVPVAALGTSVARLVVRPAEGADETDLAAAFDRAPEAFGIALVRTGAVTPEDQVARELLRALDAAEPEQVARLAGAAGLTETTRAVGVEVRGTDMTALGAVDAVLRRQGRRVLGSIVGGVLTGLVVLSDTGRPGLLGDLRAARLPSSVRVGVGPVARGPYRYAHTLAASAHCLTTADEYAWPDWLVDAELAGAELLLAGTASASQLRDFVVDQLGDLLASSPARARTLVETLDAYLTNGCSKTATARTLHLQRQALYQRLARIFTALGGDPAGTPRLASIQLACRLYVSGLVQVQPGDSSGRG